ncbi:MAG: M12 family metallo-peptidase [Phycisphaerales bacterium JB047]
MLRTHTLKAGLALCIAALSTSAMAQVDTHRLNGSRIDIESVDTVLVGEHVRIENFDTPKGQLDLELDRVEVLTPDARLELGTANGIVDLPRPEVVVLRGIVAGDADSIAYIAFSPYGTNGFIRQNGELISISTGPYAQGVDLDAALKTAYMADLVDPDEGPISACGYTAGDVQLEPMGLPEQAAQTTPRGGATCRIAGIAIETDYEYSERLFNGNTSASAAYIISLMGAISEIYERDVDTRLAVPFLRVWESDTDPYDATTGDPLDQVLNHWNANMTDVDRTVTHFFTGRENTSYGGVAYVGVLCNNEYGYGVSAHLVGSFPYPLVDHNGGNWDVVVAAHELGHNFGTGHTHSYTPPIDGCGNGDCSDPYGGTIMSYCHGCSGGLTNIVLGFDDRVKTTIINFMNSSGCNLIGEGVSAADDIVETLEGNAVEIDALGNDASQSCDPFMLDTFDSTTLAGGSVELLAGQGTNGQDMFRYTPPAGYSGNDAFSYTIIGDSGSSTANVNIDVRQLRAADDRLNPIDGLSVDFYELSSPSSLPDFDAMTPYMSDVVTSVDFGSTGGEFLNSGRSDGVGAVFKGYVWALIDGVYTFTTESDDGSALYIGDERVVNNDGLHGMVKRSGSIPLSAGWHSLRIEFFENGGGAGLISTIAGPGMPEQNLTGLLLSHESNAQCSQADFDLDGDLDFFDVAAFIEAYNTQDDDADLNGDGELNFFDISAFILAYEAGCP